MSAPAFLTSWGTLGSGPGQFNLPVGVGVDGAGDVYVADELNHRIQRFTSDGTFVTTWGSVGTGDGQLLNPKGVAVDGDGYVYVADSGNNRVQKFTSTGTYVTQWGTVGTGEGQFSNPTGVGVDVDGNVYVADWGNNRVQKFTSTGTYVTQWGTFGTGDGQFNIAAGVAVSGDGIVYVTDWGNARVQAFTTNGTFVATWGQGHLVHPWGVALAPGGDVYVTDETANHAVVFSATGEYLTEWGTSGSGEGQFSTPLGVALDEHGSVYIADYGHQRIQKFGDVTDPTVDLLTPLDGATYTRDEVVGADYSCADGVGGSGIATCVGTVPDGSAVDTSVLGDHDFTVTATDRAGNTSSVTHTYTVADVTDPTIDLVTPPDGAVYAHNRAVTADYTCTDDLGGSGIVACEGDVADGSAVDTTTLGDHDFTVTATDGSGNTADVTHTYTVADPRPDGRIKKGTTGAYVGDDVYVAGPAQTRTGSAARGHTVTYYVSAQNDAPFPEVLRLRGTATNTRYRVTYTVGGVDVTSQITAGTYETPELAPGAAFRVKVVVKVKLAAPVGSSLRGSFVIKSGTDPTMRDTVQFVTRRA